MAETYPAILLPRPNYKYIDCDLSDCYLIRYFELKDNIPLYDDNGDIAQTYICSPEGQIQDLSLSLLGHFTCEHTKITLTGIGKEKFSHYCLPSYPGELLQNPEEFFISENRNYWLLKASACDSLKCTVKTVKERTETDHLTKSYKEHTPMRWNFWHFSLRWDIEGKGKLSDPLVFSDEKEKKKFSDKIGAKIRSKLPSLVKLAPDQPIVLLADTCYQN